MVRFEWRLDRVKRVVAVVAALAVVAVAVPVVTSWLEERRERCSSGVVKKPVQGEQGGEECVGVTDGSHVFEPNLANVPPQHQLGGVSNKIKKENDRVKKENEEKGTPYVTVAYMTTLTLTEEDSNPPESIRNELEGAYKAQRRHNAGDLKTTPRIRLLIANTGSDSAHWKHTVDELTKLRDSSDRLVAVAGLGPSHPNNIDAIKALSKRKLATVASIMTDSDLGQIENFARVPPTNDDQASAAARYLHDKDYDSAALVEDTAERNPYASSLGPAFSRAFKAGGGDLDDDLELSFDSSSANRMESEMRLMPSQLCQEKHQAIYFAGRGKHLKLFLDALANRENCTDRDFTVISGDDSSNLTAEELREASDTGIDVLYTGIAHPDMWEADQSAVSKRADQLFKKTDDDGQAIVAHDSVVTVSQALAMLNDTDGEENGESVGGMFYKMRQHKVPGASGWISFDERGNPRDKAIPILQLKRSGRAHLEDVSSPTGSTATAKEN